MIKRATFFKKKKKIKMKPVALAQCWGTRAIIVCAI